MAPTPMTPRPWRRRWTVSEAIHRTDDAFVSTASAACRFNYDIQVYVKYAEGVKLSSLFETSLGLLMASQAHW